MLYYSIMDWTCHITDYEVACMLLSQFLSWILIVLQSLLKLVCWFNLTLYIFFLRWYFIWINLSLLIWRTSLLHIACCSDHSGWFCVIQAMPLLTFFCMCYAGGNIWLSWLFFSSLPFLFIMMPTMFKLSQLFGAITYVNNLVRAHALLNICWWEGHSYLSSPLNTKSLGKHAWKPSGHYVKWFG